MAEHRAAPAEPASRPAPPGGPLDPVTSIRTKLGLLVGVSVLAAVLLGTVGASAGLAPWLSVPVAVALSLGVTQLLAAGMTAPLRQMTDVAQRMARGDYGGRVHTQATDEVGRLAAAFNRMAEDLLDVERERRDLVATVSHELRTPLAGLRAVLENLADGVVPADPEHLGGALAQTERLSAIVADLLDLSRVEAGVVPLALEQVDLAAAVRECLRDVAAAGRPVRHALRVPEGLRVTADPGRLRQLLTNALDNAQRHSPAGGVVTVSAGVLPDGTAAASGTDGWWLEVADDGLGIDPADRERVFERFGTLAGPGGTGGTGLGLAVARWVATLHGGTLRFVDPAPGATSGPTSGAGAGAAGARLRLELTGPPPIPAQPPVSSQEATVPAPTSTLPPAPTGPDAGAPGPSLVEGLLGRVWPERGLPARRDLLAAALGTGLLAGLLLPDRPPGVAALVVLAAAGGTVVLAARHRRDRFTLACLALAGLLSLVVVLRDAGWLQALCVVVGAGLMVVGVTRGRRPVDLVVAAVAWPLAGLRGLPWLGRGLRGLAGPGRSPAVLRTALASVAGVAVFGLLFASADALFASWVGALVPDLRVDVAVTRVFVTVFVGGVTLAAAYVALNPALRLPAAGAVPPSRHRVEWLAPVLLVDAVFALFLVAQATAAFGGHAYLERTTGLTYADYVHQGFGQLTVATALTLLVVRLAAGRVGDDPADRRWLHASLGVLCAATLVVVASALHRMHLYQEAYGFTSLRLVVDVFEGWLGLVVLLVLMAGAWRRFAPQLARTALLAGALAVVGLAAINPDAWVAERNIDRYEETGSLDVGYLLTLSADAAPVIAERLPADVARCAVVYLPLNQLTPADRDDPLAWNLGRSRAAGVVDDLEPPTYVDPGCAALIGGLDRPDAVGARSAG